MRLTVVTAAVCLCLVGFSAANPSQASIRKSTNIPAEGLGPALEALAKDRNFQIVYVSEEINDLRTQGAVGELTPEEALKKLLSGTGLTYRYLDDKTVTIIPAAQGSGAYAAPAPGGTSSNPEPLPIQLAQAATAPTNPDQPSSADLPQPQSVEPKKDDELAQIVVTGTRISGVGSALTTPIITITHEEILERGYSSVQDVLGTLTMEYSNVNSSSFVASGNVTSPDSNGKGLSAVNLRGLGTGSTLVLIDGQRSANAPTADGAMVDLTKIPVGMIDHIDVITGSASSIYGGDAIAGVINIITRKDYQGAETFVSAVNSNSGADGYEIRQLLGTGWGSGNITANFNADHQLPAQTAELGITTQDQVSRGGRDWRDYNFTSPPQLITDGVTPIPGGTSETFSALLPPGNGTNVHPNNLTYISNEDASNMSGNYKLLTPTNDTLERYLTPNNTDYSGRVALTQRLFDGLDMTLFASYSRRESTTVNYELVNPELVPASNAFNHFGQPVLVDYSFYNEIASGLLPAPTEISDSTAVSGGGTFSLALPWGDWRSRLQFGLERDTEYSATQQIANVYNAAYVTQPAGALAAYTAALDSSNPNTALNLFGNGTGSGKDVKFANFLYEAGTGNTVSDLKSATLSFDGTVLTLPTGKVKAAVGAEIRNESLDFTQYILNVFPENPSRNLDAVFGELLVPLLGDENQRGGRDVLQLELAGRYDHYRITGPFGADTGEVDSRGSEILSTETKTFAASSPQIGLRWQPVRDLTLKANWSKAFQAPTIQDLFTPGVSIPQTTYDPYNPASNGGPKTVSFILLGGGNPNLQPQTSTSSTFEVAYKPAQLPGLSAVVDFNHTRVTNVITIGVQSSIAPGYAQYLEYPALNPGVMRNAQGVLQDINFADINAAVQISQSIDLRLFYDFEIDHWGNFSVGTAATDTMKLSEQISPGAPAVNIAGTVAGPSTWHVIPSVLWARGSWGANLYVNFNSAVANDDITSPQRVVGSITTVDTQVYWKLPREGWRFAMGAHNLFNVTPPFYDTPYGVDFSRYNPAARQIYANVTKSFGGGAK